MSKLKVTTISDPDNDNTAMTVSSTGACTFAQDASFSGNIAVTGTIPASQLTGTLPALDGSALTGVGSPAEVSRNYKAQLISTGITTKILFNGTPTFDTDSAWDSTNNWFKPTVGGYYHIHISSNGSTSDNYNTPSIYKNGSYYSALCTKASSATQVNSFDIVYLNGSTDYIEIYALSSNAYLTTVTMGITVVTSLVKAD